MFTAVSKNGNNASLQASESPAIYVFMTLDAGLPGGTSPQKCLILGLHALAAAIAARPQRRQRCERREQQNGEDDPLFFRYPPINAAQSVRRRDAWNRPPDPFDRPASQTP
jgi:hypothetical protein